MIKSKLYEDIRNVILEQYENKPHKVIAKELNVSPTTALDLIHGFRYPKVEISSITVTADLEAALESWGYRIELVKIEDNKEV